jgi:hypothetical protein
MRISASSKIYFVSTTIPVADDGVGHVSGAPWLPDHWLKDSLIQVKEFSGHATDRRSSELRMINRIWLGVVDDGGPDLRRNDVARMAAGRSVSKNQVTLIL